MAVSQHEAATREAPHRTADVSAVGEMVLSIRAALRGEGFLEPHLVAAVRAWVADQGRTLASICPIVASLPRSLLPLDGGDVRDGLCEFAFTPKDRLLSELHGAFDGPLPRALSRDREILHRDLTRELGSYAEAIFTPMWQVLRRVLPAWWASEQRFTDAPTIRSPFVDAPVLFGEHGGEGCALPLVPGPRRAAVAGVRLPDPPVLTPLVGGDRAMMLMLADHEAVTTAAVASWTGLSPEMVRYHGMTLSRAGLLDYDTGSPRLWRRTRLGQVLANSMSLA